MYRQLSPIALCLYLYLCGMPPPDLDLSPTGPTAHGLYVVDLPPLAEPVLVSRLHAWEVSVTSPAGEPGVQAAIDVHGDMP